VNRALGRTGRLFADRHHREVLRTPRQVRHALAYVLLNRRHHLQQWGCLPATVSADEYSSAAAFDGWSRPVGVGGEAPAVARPRTWLCAVGWKKHGLIDPAEVPGGRSHAGKSG
jgi:hypothetical protein